MLNYTYMGRTYSNESLPNHMGPTMRVKPGQTMWIKLSNELYGNIGPKPPTAVEYWNMLQAPGEAIKYQR